MTYSLMFFGLASLLCATQSLLMPNPSALFQQSLNGFKTELGEFLAESPVYRDIVVVGSGPAGLATAIMLAKHNRTKGKIKLFDQLDEPPRLDDTVSWNVENKFERSYIIGLSGRGQKVLGDLGCIERIKEYSISLSGAKVWEPGTPEDAPKERVFTDRAYTTVCIERDRLSSCLVAELREKYNNTVDLRFNVKAKELHVHTDSGGSEFVEVEFEDTSSSSSSPYSTSTDTPKTFKEYSSLVIGADGANSAVRDALVDIKKESGMNFHVKTFEDKNVRVYRTIPLYLPNNTKANGIWNKTWSYSARTKSDINLEALPCFGPAQLGVVLFRPWDTRITSLKTGADAKQFFDTHLPQFSSCLRQKDLEQFATKSNSKFPRFGFTGPVLHHGSSVVLVGDSIHTVKPFFGLGVNSAFEDVAELDMALKHSINIKGSIPTSKTPITNTHTSGPFSFVDTSKALELYSKNRAKEAKALVNLSRGFDGGFLTFVLPLILDSICHKLLPRIFSQNAIASMQNEKNRFTQVQNTKRCERVLQSIIGLVVLGLVVKVYMAGVAGIQIIHRLIMKKFYVVPAVAMVAPSLMEGVGRQVGRGLRVARLPSRMLVKAYTTIRTRVFKI